jgi:hypothetical protein
MVPVRQTARLLAVALAIVVLSADRVVLSAHASPSAAAAESARPSSASDLESSARSLGAPRGRSVPAVEASPAATAEDPNAKADEMETAAPETEEEPAESTEVSEPEPAPAPVAVAAPAACPSSWFCYPRLGIAGPIVPYSDCKGATDVGASIRALTCIAQLWLAAHAWTQFGRITGWRAGDVVFAYGRAYTVTGAVVARSCESPPQPYAPLSLQTSLGPAVCGPVLVVQAR